MRMFIPPISMKFRLLADWTFPLVSEGRNATLWAALVGPIPQRDWRGWPESGRGYSMHPVTIPAGTELTVSRIYIRQGGKEFDSVTFNLIKWGGPEDFKKGGPSRWGGTRKGTRFWAKLEYVNRIEFDVISMPEAHFSQVVPAPFVKPTPKPEDRPRVAETWEDWEDE